MPTLAIFFGILLDILGIGGYVMTGAHAPTALIPAVLGTLILILGILASRNPGLRKHAMHGVAILAVLGLLGGAMRAIPNIPKICHSSQVNVPGQINSAASPETIPSQTGVPDQLGAPDQPGGGSIQPGMIDHRHHVAFWMQTIMAILCLILLIFCVKSFIAARRGNKTLY